MGKRGPQPAYERIKDDQRGAPLLNVRLNTPVYSRIKSRPEGPRAYVERLVTEDADRSGESLVGHEVGLVEESVSPEDVPGQLLLNGPPQKAKE